ncbi:MAG: thioredoxin fold domain-containing protein [Flavobacteriales bacterium]|nr:thioredoxin fold domain-containing protein [Flavobacteriales bacterium]
MSRAIVVVLLLICGMTMMSQVKFFEGSFEEAKAVAAKEGKPLFIDFYADWCVPCKQMEKYGFRDKDFSFHINTSFIAVKVDVEQFVGMDVAEAYRVNKYPTLIITDSRGKELRRREGYQSAEQLSHFAEEG